MDPSWVRTHKDTYRSFILPGGPVAACAGYLVLAIPFVFLTLWSWRKWPDILIDFGNELYIPWQLTQGKHLYLDIAHFMGPLSKYMNALLFSWFGVSFTTLIVANLIITAGMVYLIFRFFENASNRLTGAVVSLVFLFVFAFSHNQIIGNMNYISPYAHEQTHGLALALMMLFCLSTYFEKQTPWRLYLSGLCLGLSFLTKTEVFIPAAGASLAALSLTWYARRHPLRYTLKLLCCYAGMTLLPVVACFIFLWSRMPLATAGIGILGNWVYMADSSMVLHDDWYRAIMGLDNIKTNFRMMLELFAMIAAVLSVAALIDFITRGVRKFRLPFYCSLGGLIVVACFRYGAPAFWLQIGRPLPLVMMFMLVIFVGVFGKQIKRGESGAQAYALTLWALYSWLSLGKILFNVQLGHLGFALAMPATLLFVAAIVSLAPYLLRRFWGNGNAFRAVSLSLVLVAMISFFLLSDRYYRAKTLPVGADGDRIMAYDPQFVPYDFIISEAVKALSDLVPDDADLMVLPEGVIFNYLLRRTNPTPYYVLTPWEMAAFGGEAAVRETIAAHAPEFIVVVDRDMGEYGIRFFGSRPEYGGTIMKWISDNYERVRRIGSEPNVDDRFGIDIYCRNSLLAGKKNE